ncbi:MAG: hypothetical protein AAF517_25580, partial [Planctomycetota bacterium]
DPEHVGAGFLVGSKVVTCAHVVLDHGLDADGKIAWDRVFFRLHSGELIGVDGPSSSVFERWDLIALAPEAQSHESVRAAWSAEIEDLEGTGRLLYTKTTLDLTSAMVLGIGTLRHRDEAVWMPPGQVVFPQRIRKPLTGTSAGADRAFKQAFKAQLWGRLDSITPSDKPISVLDSLELAIADLLSPEANSLALYESAGGRALDLRYSAVSDALKERVGESFRIPCFGSDIVSAGSNSGSPVFVLTKRGAAVVGIHCGRVGDGSNGGRPRLDRFKRAIPFAEAWNAVLKAVCEE